MDPEYGDLIPSFGWILDFQAFLECNLGVLCFGIVYLEFKAMIM